MTIAKKVCLMGDFAVGKTSLVRRFVHNRFDDTFVSTIGVRVSRRTLVIPRDEDVVALTMMIWDLGGSEEFDRVRANYLRAACGCVLVCDLTRPHTLDSLQVYANHLVSRNPAARLAVAANKRDLVNQQRLTPQEIEAVAASLDAPYHLTSAKTGDEVETLFRHLGRLLVT
jgi:small GTP-binding protein